MMLPETKRLCCFHKRYGKVTAQSVINIQTDMAHTQASLMAILPGEPGVSGFPLVFPSPNTIPLCPFSDKKRCDTEGRGGGPWRVIGAVFVAGCSSCHRPALMTSTGTHPFFNQRKEHHSHLHLLLDVSSHKIQIYMA